MRTFPRAALVTGAAAALLMTGGAAPAQAKIVPGESISRVELGMTRKQAIEAVGRAPIARQTGTNDFGRFTILVFSQKLRVQHFRFRGVVLVTTKSPAQKTNKGVGVGSTKRKLTNKYPGVECERIQGEPGQICTLGELLPGERVTDFRVANRVVQSVSVGVVVD